MIAELEVVDTVQEMTSGNHDPIRTTLTEKIEALELGFGAMLQKANAAVVEMVEGVRSAVVTTANAVQGAVHDMSNATREGVRDTAEGLERALDMPAHVRRHPWLMVGGALLLGVVLGKLVGRVGRSRPLEVCS